MLYELDSEYKPFVVLERIGNKETNDGGMFLSSDGAGNMSLKHGNFAPPEPSTFMDPALLFRLVPVEGN